MDSKNNLLSPDQGEGKPPSSSRNLTSKGSFFVPENSLIPFYPYLQNALSKQQHRYYHANGHASLLKKLQIEVYTDIKICQKLWQEFSRPAVLFDTWDFRTAFWHGYNHQPYFMVLKEGFNNLALLPLWYESDKKTYAWFGSAWQEENKFLAKDPLFIPLMLAVCPKPVLLNAISADLPIWTEEVITLQADDPKFILKLDSLDSSQDYLLTLKKKKRYNLRRDQKIIEAQEPIITFDRLSDFDALVNLSIKRFEEKGEDTDWQDPRRVEAFRQIIRLGKQNGQYQVRTITVTIGNHIAAVDLIAIFQNCYYPLKCGYDVKNFPGIGSFVNLLEIDDAIQLGMRKMDFLEIGYGWKEKWFEAVPLLKYEK